MAKTKKTLQKSDVKGKLPPLGPPKQKDERWGSAAQTFAQKFEAPMKRDGSRKDYRSKCPK